MVRRISATRMLGWNSGTAKNTARKGLRGDPVGEGADHRADEVHLAVEAGQDLLAHLLGLVDRLELVGDEGQRGAAASALCLVGVGRAAGEAHHGGARAERQGLAARLGPSFASMRTSA